MLISLECCQISKRHIKPPVGEIVLSQFTTKSVLSSKFCLDEAIKHL